MSESEKVDSNWRDEPLEQLLLLITSEPLQPQMLKLINLPRLLEQLKPAIDVLHFGGKVVGPQEVAVLDACAAAEIGVGGISGLPVFTDNDMNIAIAEAERRKTEG